MPASTHKIWREQFRKFMNLFNPIMNVAAYKQSTEEKKRKHSFISKRRYYS